MYYADLDTLALKIKDMAQQYDELFEQKSFVDSELTQTQSRFTTEVSELKSHLNTYKQRLESKEQVEIKAKADLHQASTLNEEVRFIVY